jgi:hypothetical protein
VFRTSSDYFISLCTDWLQTNLRFFATLERELYKLYVLI